MEQKFGLDAIGYLVDRPRAFSGAGEPPRVRASHDEIKLVMRQQVATLRRELERMEADLQRLEAQPCDPPAKKPLGRRLAELIR